MAFQALHVSNCANLDGVDQLRFFFSKPLDFGKAVVDCGALVFLQVPSLGARIERFRFEELQLGMLGSLFSKWVINVLIHGGRMGL